MRDPETSLLKQHPQAEARGLLKPFALAQDREFWSHAQDGLAVLGATRLFRVFRLQSPGLSKVRLFEGSRDTLDEIVPTGAKTKPLAATIWLR